MSGNRASRGSVHSTPPSGFSASPQRQLSHTPLSTPPSGLTQHATPPRTSLQLPAHHIPPHSQRLAQPRRSVLPVHAHQTQVVRAARSLTATEMKAGQATQMRRQMLKEATELAYIAGRENPRFHGPVVGEPSPSQGARDAESSNGAGVGGRRASRTNVADGPDDAVHTAEQRRVGSLNFGGAGDKSAGTGSDALARANSTTSPLLLSKSQQNSQHMNGAAPAINRMTSNTATGADAEDGNPINKSNTTTLSSAFHPQGGSATQPEATLNGTDAPEAGSRYKDALTTTLSALVCSVLILVLSDVLALIIFEGYRLEAHGHIAISVHLGSSMVACLFTALANRAECPMIPAPSFNSTVFFVVCADILSDAIDENMSTDPSERRLLATMLFTMVTGTLLVGLACFLVGKFKISRFLQLLPGSVVSGFLVGVGYITVVEGLVVSTGIHLDASHVDDMFGTWYSWKLLLPALFIGFGLYLGKRYHIMSAPKLLFLLMVLPYILFYVILGAAGISMEECREAGWLFPVNQRSDFWEAWELIPGSMDLIDFTAFSKTIPQLLAMVGIVVLDYQLQSIGAEKAMGFNLDYDPQHEMTGMFNLLSVVPIGVPCYAQLKLDVINMAITGKKQGRMTTVLCAVAMCILYLGGFPIINYMPRFFLGGLVLWAGLVYFSDNLLDRRKAFTKKEYLVVWTILIVTIFLGLLIAVVSGFVLAMVVFVIQNSRLPFFTVFSMRTTHSGMDRPMRHLRKLEQLGNKCMGIRLSGLLFFGSASKVQNEVEVRIKEDASLPPWRRMEYLLLDFYKCHSVDSNATNMFCKIGRMCLSTGVTIVWCGMSDKVSTKLRRDGALNPSSIMMQDADHGLEWAEEHVLHYAGMIRSKWLILPSMRKLNALSVHRSLHNPFQDFVVNNWVDLQGFCIRRTEEAGFELYRAGEHSDTLWILLSGSVTSYLEHNDRTRKRVSTRSSGAFGNNLLKIPCAETAVCDQRSMFVCIDREQVTRLIRDHASLAVRLERLVLHDVTSARNRMERELDEDREWDGYQKLMQLQERDVCMKSRVLTKFAQAVDIEAGVLRKMYRDASVASPKGQTEREFSDTNAREARLVGDVAGDLLDVSSPRRQGSAGRLPGMISEDATPNMLTGTPKHALTATPSVSVGDLPVPLTVFGVAAGHLESRSPARGIPAGRGSVGSRAEAERHGGKVTFADLPPSVPPPPPSTAHLWLQAGPHQPFTRLPNTSRELHAASTARGSYVSRNTRPRLQLWADLQRSTPPPPPPAVPTAAAFLPPSPPALQKSGSSPTANSTTTATSTASHPAGEAKSHRRSQSYMWRVARVEAQRKTRARRRMARERLLRQTSEEGGAALGVERVSSHTHGGGGSEEEEVQLDLPPARFPVMSRWQSSPGRVTLRTDPQSPQRASNNPLPPTPTSPEEHTGLGLPPPSSAAGPTLAANLKFPDSAIKLVDVPTFPTPDTQPPPAGSLAVPANHTGAEGSLAVPSAAGATPGLVVPVGPAAGGSMPGSTQHMGGRERQELFFAQSTFEYHLSKVQTELYTEAWKAHAVFDETESTWIVPQEALRHLIMDLGFYETESEMRDLLTLEQVKRGIDLPHFLHLMCVVTMADLSEEQCRLYHSVFSHFDSNKSGFLDRYELNALFMHTAKEQLTADELDELLEEWASVFPPHPDGGFAADGSSVESRSSQSREHSTGSTSAAVPYASPSRTGRMLAWQPGGAGGGGRGAGGGSGGGGGGASGGVNMMRHHQSLSASEGPLPLSRRSSSSLGSDNEDDASKLRKGHHVRHIPPGTPDFAPQMHLPGVELHELQAEWPGDSNNMSVSRYNMRSQRSRSVTERRTARLLGQWRGSVETLPSLDGEEQKESNSVRQKAEAEVRSGEHQHNSSRSDNKSIPRRDHTESARDGHTEKAGRAEDAPLMHTISRVRPTLAHSLLSPVVGRTRSTSDSLPGERRHHYPHEPLSAHAQSTRHHNLSRRRRVMSRTERVPDGALVFEEFLSLLAYSVKRDLLDAAVMHAFEVFAHSAPAVVQGSQGVEGDDAKDGGDTHTGAHTTGGTPPSGGDGNEDPLSPPPIMLPNSAEENQQDNPGQGVEDHRLAERVITARDIQRVVKRVCGVEPTLDECREMLFEADVEGLGYLAFENFVDMVTIVYEPGWVVWWVWKKHTAKRFMHHQFVDGEFDELSEGSEDELTIA